MNGLFECFESDCERKCKVKCELLYMDLLINKDVMCDFVKGKWDIDIYNIFFLC